MPAFAQATPAATFFDECDQPSAVLLCSMQRSREFLNTWILPDGNRKECVV